MANFNQTFASAATVSSIASRMDPRVKLGLVISFVVLVFVTQNFIALGILIVPVITLYCITPLLDKAKLWRSAITAIGIGIFLFIINLFVVKATDSSSDVFTPLAWWKLTITERAVFNSLLITIRVYIMIIATGILINTTTPVGLTYAVEFFIYPLKFIFVPVHVIAMIIAIALRFVPTFLDEAQRIMKAQSSRGVDFKNSGFKTKTKALITLVIPLFVSSFSKAEDLGNAMEVRGYSPNEKRTRYRIYKLRWEDILAGLLGIGLIVFIALNVNNVFTLPNWH